MDKLLVQKWLEQGERIEKRHLDVLRKNKANNGLTDGTDSFRQIYYHFDQLNDAQINEVIKVLNGFQRGKSSGTAGREVVKDFLSNCLILLGSQKNREELKQYLGKNGLMPVDNSEELRRLEELHRRQQELLRRQKEEEEKRRAAAEEERRRKIDDQQRQREIERQQREDKRRKDVEAKQKDWDIYEQDIDHFTAEREQYVVSRMKNKRFNIPWKGVLKVIAVIAVIYMFFSMIGFIKGFVSGMLSSSNPAVEYNGTTNTDVHDENMNGEENYIGSNFKDREDEQYDNSSGGLYESLPEGTFTYSGDMGGYPIELTITNDPDNGILTAIYRNINYGTTLTMTGGFVQKHEGDIYFSSTQEYLELYLTGDRNEITGVAIGDKVQLDVTLRPK